VRSGESIAEAPINLLLMSIRVSSYEFLS
jgi:hypothetical protein